MKNRGFIYDVLALLLSIILFFVVQAWIDDIERGVLIDGTDTYQED